jgi:hypothetical protein
MAGLSLFCASHARFFSAPEPRTDSLRPIISGGGSPPGDSGASDPSASAAGTPSRVAIST